MVNYTLKKSSCRTKCQRFEQCEALHRLGEAHGGRITTKTFMQSEG